MSGNRKSKIKNQKCPGFTLIELLVVMSVIAILAGILLPTIITVRRMAKRGATKNLLQQIAGAAEQYSADCGQFPPDTAPSGTQFVKFVGYELGKSFAQNSFSATVQASSEALYYFLGNPNITGSHPYIELQKEVQYTDYNGNNLPEAVDSWGRPFLYNRAEFPDAGGQSQSAWDAHGDPGHHHPDHFDLYSVGPDGQSNKTDIPSPKTNLSGFDDKALHSSGYGNGRDDVTNW